MTEQKLRCPDCGTRPEESDPKLGGDLNAYYLEKYTCFACKNIEDGFADERKASGKKNRIRPGFKLRLVPNYVHLERLRIRKQLAIKKVKDKALEVQLARLKRPNRISSK
jgi:hypothetical protein